MRAGLPYQKLILGYVCGHGDAHSLHRLVEASKIPLIFDLDQTLIHAFTMKGLAGVLSSIAADMCAAVLVCLRSAVQARVCLLR